MPAMLKPPYIRLEQYATCRLGNVERVTSRLLAIWSLTCLAYCSGTVSGSGPGSACLIQATWTCAGVTPASLRRSATFCHVPLPLLAQLETPAPPIAQFTSMTLGDFCGSRSAKSLKRLNSPAVFDM